MWHKIANNIQRYPSFISFCISLPLSFKTTDILLDIFAWLYALNEGVELKELSEDYGFGMLGLLFAIGSFFLFIPLFYILIKKHIIKYLSHS